MAYTISKTFRFCYGHRLLRDESQCRHLHGHTAKATIILKGERLDHRGMVAHFSELKKTIGAWIQEEIDHTMLLSEADPILECLSQAGERVKVLPFNPTAENIAHMIFEETQRFGFEVIAVELWESETSMASYRGGI